MDIPEANSGGGRRTPPGESGPGKAKSALIITFTEVVRDPRVLRHIAALSDRFHIETCGKGPAPPGVRRHFEIPAEADHLPLNLKGLTALTLRRTEAAYRALPAADKARRLLLDTDADVLLANDINALPLALDVAGERPVVADLHEYAPREMEDDWRWRLLVQPFFEDLCATYLERAAVVTTVGEGIAEEYRIQYGVRPRVVWNAGEFREPEVRPTGNPIRAVHSGFAVSNRRIETMIEAAGDLPGLTFDLYLVEAAREPRYRQKLVRLAASTTNVTVRAPVPMDRLPSTLDAYDIGIYSLAPGNFNNLNALPNKFFDFVQSGLGLVTGPSPEMATLTERYGLGAVAEDFGAAALRKALRSITRERVDRWKANTCAAAEELSGLTSAQTLCQAAIDALDRSAGARA